LTTIIKKNGMTFDYRYYTNKIFSLCKELNQIFLMPTMSPYSLIDTDDTYFYFTFNHKKIPFLKVDVKLLPLSNITVEELSRYLVERLVDDADIETFRIQKIEVKVYSAPGQGASHTWRREGFNLA